MCAGQHKPTIRSVKGSHRSVRMSTISSVLLSPTVTSAIVTIARASAESVIRHIAGTTNIASARGPNNRTGDCNAIHSRQVRAKDAAAQRRPRQGRLHSRRHGEDTGWLQEDRESRSAVVHLRHSDGCVTDCKSETSEVDESSHGSGATEPAREKLSQNVYELG